jgi:photosystem II stability/assembly factor-like uncharacterized protein
MTKRLMLLVAILTVSAGAEWISIGPDGGNVQALAVDYGQPQVMYAVPYEYPDNPRLFRSSDAGASWNAVGVLSEAFVSVLAVDRHQPQVLYALGGYNSVMRSSDRGASWGSIAIPGAAQCLSSDPFFAGRVIAAGYTLGSFPEAAVFISTDFGRTWSQQALGPDTNYAYSVAFDPVNSGIAYVGCYRGMVYRTTDAGNSWGLRNTGLPAGSALTSLSVNPGDPRIVITGAADGVYRTTSAGDSWTRVGSVARTYALDFSPAQANIAYLVGYDSTTRLFVSTDTGASWTAQPSNVILGKATSLRADPLSGDGVYLNGGTGILKSSDQGAHWNMASNGIRVARIPVITVPRWERSRVYLEAAENGVFKSGNSGAAWTRCEDFLSCGSICGIGITPGTGNDVLWALEGMG